VNMRELIIDNFAGGGGASTGIEMATGYSVDIAINHDPEAIRMHKTNHPETKHYCESVWNVDPLEATQGKPVSLAWFSPDCKHFSKAKGGKPVEKNIRGLAWIVVKWAKLVKPRIIILENVEEFKTWGPLKNCKPDPKRKGETFNHFISALKGLGYTVDYRELRACDYGAPTIRKRFFLIARSDHKKIVWPEITHSSSECLDVKAGILKPWRTASECIDWSLPCPSIFERKKPLVENTMRRIAIGIQKFVIDDPNPFIVQVNYSGSKHHYCRSIKAPLSTITSKHGFGLVMPYLISYHSETKENESRSFKLDRPIHTVDTSNRYGLVTSHLLQMNNNCDGRDMKKPFQTIVAGPGHWGEVRTLLTKCCGKSNDAGQRVRKPLHTIAASDRFSIVTMHEQDYKLADIGMRMLQPKELYLAQGFPEKYIYNVDYAGEKFTKTSQIARCGNAVPPPFAKALVESNLPELCSERIAV
jgi:DNA (cytosine-5)-methyltransferase 1